MSVAELKVATREAVGNLEQRYGRKRVYIGAAIGAVVLLVVFRACVTSHKAPPPPPARPVAVAKVTTAEVPLYLDEIGTTAAYETVEIKAQVNGQIIAREFKDGADVKKGDLLFRIDPRPFEAALAAAQADQALGAANLRRQVELRAKNVTATQDWDTTEANARKAEAAVAAAQVNVDFCYIKSPIDGRVGLRNVDVGNLVGPGSPSLVTIQGLDPIYTDFTIAEPDLPLVRQYLGNPKLKVLTDAENDNVSPREGSLYFIAQTLEPGTGTVQSRAVTPNSDRALWPSQFVRVRLILDVIKDAKLVPNGAVQIGQNGPYIFVVKEDSTLDLRLVKPGQKHGELTVIKEGVRPGETVVTRGQLQLAPGTKVIVKEEEKPSADKTGLGGNDIDSVP